MMYTTTRKITMVCLAVVFSVLVYGCGGGDSKQASTEPPPTDSPDGTDMVMTPETPTVDMSMVTVGLIIPAGTFTILPGESRNQYDATFTCPAGGLSCEVTVADDGTATSVGGLATAMNSVPGNAKRDASNPPVDTSDVTVSLTIEAGMYTIQPGGNMDAGDAAFTCPAGGVPCVVTVADNGTVTSVGGAATAMNSAAGNAKRDASNPPVDTSDVTVGLTIEAGMYTIQPDGNMNAGDATFTCPAGGVPCVVTVAEGGTATSVGGAATAMNSAAGNAKRDASNPPVDTSVVVAGLIIRPGTFTIQPGELMDLYDATLTCPAGGVPCMVTVDLSANGVTTVTSAGGAATATISATGNMKLAATNPVDRSSVTAGLTAITVGMYTIQPGEFVDAGDVTFTCPVGGVRCKVTVTADVDADGKETGTTTVSSVGGTARTTDSTAGKVKLAKVNPDEVVRVLVVGYTTITPGTYIIQPGSNKDVGEANFACPAGGVPCVVTVKVGVDPTNSTMAVTTVTSSGGIPTGSNTMAVMTTIAAKALSATTDGPLRTSDMSTITSVGVTRSTDGVTTKIVLTPALTDETLFKSQAVDTGHAISGWIGQTLTRGGDDNDADDLPRSEEATVYTNIKMSSPNKLKFLGSALEDAMLNNIPFVLDPNQDEMLTEAFIGAYGGISGTYTCVAETCVAVMTTTNIVTEQRILGVIDANWEFESDEDVESAATQDEGYMYYGYWLRSPMADQPYQFTALSGGGAMALFDPPALLLDSRDALKATYKGGAAGRYVTRKLSFIDDLVDEKSPAYHGRFTANAELKAYFGTNEAFEEVIDDVTSVVTSPNNKNQVHGTITNFKDGATDLGFEVTLKRQEIGTAGAIVADGNGDMMNVTAKFSDTATNSAADGAGSWSAQFYGPAADTKANESANTKLPSGVAGQFNASSSHTVVIGAFGAQKQ